MDAVRSVTRATDSRMHIASLRSAMNATASEAHGDLPMMKGNAVHAVNQHVPHMTMTHTVEFFEVRVACLILFARPPRLRPTPGPSNLAPSTKTDATPRRHGMPPMTMDIVPRHRRSSGARPTRAGAGRSCGASAAGCACARSATRRRTSGSSRCCSSARSTSSNRAAASATRRAGCTTSGGSRRCSTTTRKGQGEPGEGGGAR